MSTKAISSAANLTGTWARMEKAGSGVFSAAGRFAWAYVKSMRLYYAFVTGIAGWIGVSYHHFLRPEEMDVFRSIGVLGILFLSWGINQIINDYLGLREDRINAPHRPMVTGELHPQAALAVSIVLIALTGIASFFLNPWSLLPLFIGVLFNVVYETAKAWSLLGNLVFGAAIANCTVYGFLAVGTVPHPLFTPAQICGLLLVLILNAVMTYYTYFKDYEGDREAGKKTFIVRHGPNVARYAGLVGAVLPASFFLLFVGFEWLPLRTVLGNTAFSICGVAALVLQVWTAIRYFRQPRGEGAYKSLSTNFQACVAGHVALISLFNGGLALVLLGASYFGIGFLFNLHADAKA
ncbi:MAG: UbiA family prenyltransferase [Planctomycetota bacterium]